MSECDSLDRTSSRLRSAQILCKRKQCDTGFDIKVKGKTVLKGGAITSTQVALDEQRNDFHSEGGVELEDVHNEARYEASGWSAGAGVYVSDKKNQDGSTVMDTDGQPVKEVNRTRGLGWGDDKGGASSTTRAGISGIAGHQDARTGDAETGLAPIFDRERVNDEVNAQVTIRRNGLPVLAKGWGDQADAQRDALRKEAAQLDAGDPARVQLLAEADRWDEGGVYRATGHAVIGGLAGGTEAALGAGGASLAAPALNDLQYQMQTALQDAGMNTLLAQEAAGLGLAGGLAVVSGAAGGNAAAGAAFNTDVNNRQLHADDRELARALAKKSKGRYTVEQIEEQMRLMGHRGHGVEPNTTEVLVDPVSIQKNLSGDPSMPKTVDGHVVVEVPGVYNAEVQAYIIANSTEGAGYIPGVSPYVGSRPTTSSRVDGQPSTDDPVRCANGDVACVSGVGAQQSSLPELTDAARNAIADAAAATSRDAGVVAAGATAVAATASPPVKPIIGTVAVGATVIGGGAAAIEQLARPNIGQAVTDGSTTVLQTVSEGTGPGRLLSPVTNEAIEAWKASGSGKALQEWVNNQFRSGK